MSLAVLSCLAWTSCKFTVLLDGDSPLQKPSCPLMVLWAFNKPALQSKILSGGSLKLTAWSMFDQRAASGNPLVFGFPSGYQQDLNPVHK